jgi:dimethylargininase
MPQDAPRRVLVRRPSPRLELGELTHLERQAVDPDLARRQWEAYVAAYRTLGWQVVEIPAADEHADGVFVEDALIVIDELAILTSPGAESRRGEVASIEPVVAALGLDVRRIEAPGTLEGGDVLVVGQTVYVGTSSRTNRDGLRQLADIVVPLGYRVEPIPVTLALHLKSSVTALPDGTVIGFEPLVDDPERFPEFLPVPEAHGSAVVVLDDTTVLMSDGAPESAGVLRERGIDVVTVPISEFEKLEGCVTCLSVRI